MSSGSEWGAVGGALVGGLLAAPTGGVSVLMGASIGLSIGSGVGAYLHPPLMGPRLRDAQTQTSTVGGAIPFGYGRFVTAGNVIWCDALKEHHRHTGGKGGSSRQRVLTRSYAIGVCEGPIRGFVWIKRNGKTIYSNDVATTRALSDEDRAAYARFSQRATIYTGTQDQTPDASLVAVEGIGNVSAFRGLAYLVVTHDDLTELMGAIPQYEFCVDAQVVDVYLSSRPYPYDLAVEAVGSSGAVTVGQLKSTLASPAPEGIHMEAARVTHASLTDSIQAINQPAEGVAMQAAKVVSGKLGVSLQAANPPPDAVQMQAARVVGGDLQHRLDATTLPSEAVQMQPASVTSGALS